MSQSYRGDIDGLRAIAVLSVIFFHFGLFGVSGGFVGVDVFFVISGYLITKQILRDLEQDRFSFSGFYIRRIRRLFPALAATLFASMVMGFLLFSPEHLLNLAKSAVSALLSVSNIFFWSEAGYFSEVSESKPLLHTWTLGVEEQYYLLCPLLLYAVWKLNRPSIWRAFVVIMFIAPILMTELYIGIDKAATFYWLPFRVSEFVIGGLVIAAERVRSHDALVTNTSFLAGLAAILYSVFFFTEETRFPGLTAMLPCAGAALMIWAKPGYPLRYLTDNHVAVWIGLISYSLYLWHWPIWVFYKYWRYTPLSLVETLVLLVTCILAGWLSYKFIEQPFRRARKSSVHPHRNYLVACAGIFLALMLASILQWHDKGSGWRLKGLPDAYATQAAAVPGRECYGKILPAFECVSGKRGKNVPNVFLLGDSHGWALRVGVTDLLGEHYRVTNARFTACPPLFGYDILKDHREITKCRKANTFLSKMIDNGEVVILAARWALYLNGNLAGIEDGTYGKSFLLSKNSDKNSNPEKAEAWFREGLDSTVKTLLQANKKVILIGQVPPVGINPVPCLSRPDYLTHTGTTSENCRYFSREQVLQRLQPSNKIIESVAKKYGVLALFPTRKLCPEKQKYCSIFGPDKTLLYRDDDHLNNHGSKYLMNLFSNEVTEYLSLSGSPGNTTSVP